MYSQNLEQQYIVNYFAQNTSGGSRKFLEIGAYDAFKFSNTRALFETGFNGIMVEPSPACFARLKEVYGNEMRIHLINAAIAENDGVVTFYEAGGDAIGTTDPDHKLKWERGANVQYKQITVPAMSMQRLMSQFGMDIDFLSLDTEGTNFKLFNLLPNYFLHRLKCICIEHDGKNQEIMAKLNSYGFRQIYLNNENLVAVK